MSDRDVEERLRERGLHVDHTTVFRWVQGYAPELDKRCRPSLTATHDAYRVDATDSNSKKPWSELYRAVDAEGPTMDFWLSATRAAQAAERLFRKALRAQQTATPRVITGDQHPAYPPAFAALPQASALPASGTLRPCKYFNTVVAQAHRVVQRRVHSGLGCGAFRTAQRTVQG